MPLNLFYTMVQKSQKWPKTQIKGGSCLKTILMGTSNSFPNTTEPLTLLIFQTCGKLLEESWPGQNHSKTIF